MLVSFVKPRRSPLASALGSPAAGQSRGAAGQGPSFQHKGEVLPPGAFSRSQSIGRCGAVSGTRVKAGVAMLIMCDDSGSE